MQEFLQTEQQFFKHNRLLSVSDQNKMSSSLAENELLVQSISRHHALQNLTNSGVSQVNEEDTQRELDTSSKRGGTQKSGSGPNVKDSLVQATENAVSQSESSSFLASTSRFEKLKEIYDIIMNDSYLLEKNGCNGMDNFQKLNNPSNKAYLVRDRVDNMTSYSEARTGALDKNGAAEVVIPSKRKNQGPHVIQQQVTMFENNLVPDLP